MDVSSDLFYFVGITSEHDQTILSFDLNELSLQESMKRAELRLPNRATRQRNQKYRVRIISFQNEIKLAEKRHTVKSQRESNNEHIILDLTLILKGIIENNLPITKVQINVQEKTTIEQQKHSIFQNSNDDLLSEEKSILVIFTKNKKFFENMIKTKMSKMTESSSEHLQEMDPAKDIRHKRTTGRYRLRSNRGRCRRHDFMIDFDAVGWGDHIIYPKRFNAYHCRGRCPTPVEQSYDPTNHAILQGIARLSNKHIPSPCCIPTKLRPISMLYYENQEIVLRHHEDMVAENCGCR